jgi:hypothetical protein
MLGRVACDMTHFTFQKFRVAFIDRAMPSGKIRASDAKAMR